MAEPIKEAARAVASADALLITAGAGIGVDSGLPDFRGNQGFWNAYPPYAKLGLSFADLANPRWFRTDPEFAWGFYGHRLALYRATKPHVGFAILRAWAARMKHGGFVFTSNVDGQFQRAGYDGGRIVECHGAIDWLQCTQDGRCDAGIFSADGVSLPVDPETFRAAPPLPICPRCGSLARPNVLMFGDGTWNDARSEAQSRRFDAWLEEVHAANGRLAIVECGAGTAVPTVRALGERLTRGKPGTLIRINVREPEVPAGQIGIASSAPSALTAIDELWK